MDSQKGTIAPSPSDVSRAGIGDGKQYRLPWIPDWVDLNTMVPLIATVIVVAVGILVVCVALSKRRIDDHRGGPKDVYCRFSYFITTH